MTRSLQDFIKGQPKKQINTKKMFQKIQDCILLGIEVNLKKELSGFLITLKKDNQEKFVLLPLDHLAEHKITKYIDLMMSKF